jgi:hypothetical protein
MHVRDASITSTNSIVAPPFRFAVLQPLQSRVSGGRSSLVSYGLTTYFRRYGILPIGRMLCTSALCKVVLFCSAYACMRCWCWWLRPTLPARKWSEQTSMRLLLFQYADFPRFARCTRKLCRFLFCNRFLPCRWLHAFTIASLTPLAEMGRQCQSESSVIVSLNSLVACRSTISALPPVKYN